MRRLWSLLLGLPHGGALHRALDPQGWQWGNTEELLAGVIESIDVTNRNYFATHRTAGQPMPPPVKVTRPERDKEPPKPRRKATTADLIAMAGKDRVIIAKDGQHD